MKRIKLGGTIAILAIILGMSLGCATTAQKVSVCDTVPEGQVSVICDLAVKSGTTPEMVAGVLKLANVAGLSGKLYTAQQANIFLDEIILALQGLQDQGLGLTYEDAVKYIITKFSGLTPEVQALFIVLDDFTGYTFDTPQILSDFDIGLLLKHLRDQKALLLPFLGSA